MIDILKDKIPKKYDYILLVSILEHMRTPKNSKKMFKVC